MSLHRKDLRNNWPSFLSHTLFQTCLNRVLFVKEPTKPLFFYMKSVLYIVLLIWGFSFFDENNFIENPYGITDSFLHKVSLAFHEAGHLIFSFLGKFMLVFGGTLMQCLIPLMAVVQFIRQRDNFEASVALWWLGQNFLDIAPYIYDAWDKKLPLLGGGTGQDHPETHDWYYLLRVTNSLENYAEVASFVVNLGKFMILLSFVWGGFILYKNL